MGRTATKTNAHFVPRFFIYLQAVNTRNTGLQGLLAGLHACSTSRFSLSLTEVLACLPTFPISVKKIYQFAPFPPIQCYLLWWSCHFSFPTLSGGGGEEKGVPYSSDAISYCFQNSLLTHVPIIWSRRAKDFCRGLKVRLLACMLVPPQDFPFLASWGMVIKISGDWRGVKLSNIIPIPPTKSSV